MLGERPKYLKNIAQLTIDSPMGSVRASPHLGGCIDLNMLNHKRIHIQSLGGASKAKFSELLRIKLMAIVKLNLHIRAFPQQYNSLRLLD